MAWPKLSALFALPVLPGDAPGATTHAFITHKADPSGCLHGDHAAEFPLTRCLFKINSLYKLVCMLAISLSRCNCVFSLDLSACWNYFAFLRFYIMAEISSPAPFLKFPMRFLKVVLLMLMSSSCSIAAALLGAAPWAPGHFNKYGRHDHARSANHQHASSKHAATHRLHNKNDARGVRFDMTRRASSCEESTMLQGAEPRSRHVACALVGSARRLRLLAGKKTKTEHLRGVTRDTAAVLGEASSDWKFPESVGVGDFVVSIYLGTPPVRANIIIDTSSDLTWIQSQPCLECYTQVDPIFDPSKSSTYKKIACSSPICDELLKDKRCSSGSCRYAYQYGYDSETDGYFSTETMTVRLTTGRKSKVARFQFGASDVTTGWLAVHKENEGVFGLGQGPISLPSQLGREFGNKFSYCLVHWQSNETSSMYFGDAAVPKGEVQYTPIVPNARFPSLYYIRVMGISVGPTRLPIEQSVFEIADSSGHGGTIIHTGSTAAWFLPKAYDHIVAAYKSQVKYPISTASMTGLDLCFDMAGVTSPSFPTMKIHLDGAHLSLPTPNTFITLEENITCLAIFPNYDTTNFQFSVLGNVQQQNYDIVYDLEHMKIGFSAADCASV